MGCIVTNVTVRTWRQKKHIVVAKCERALNDSKTLCLWTSPLAHQINSYVWSVSRTLEWLSQVSRFSHPAECNCHLLCRMTSESYLMSSLPFLHLYISQSKFHMSCLIPRSSSTCTACTTMYYRSFNVWNKLLKMYIHTSEFVSIFNTFQQQEIFLTQTFMFCEAFWNTGVKGTIPNWPGFVNDLGLGIEKTFNVT